MSLKASYRQKQEELALARTDLAFANTEFERQSKLVATNAVSRAKFDAVRHDLDVAPANSSAPEPCLIAWLFPCPARLATAASAIKPRSQRAGEGAFFE